MKIIDSGSIKFYYDNNLHRIGMPAIIWNDSAFSWCFKGIGHRINGVWYYTGYNRLEYSLYCTLININVGRLVI